MTRFESQRVVQPYYLDLSPDEIRELQDDFGNILKSGSLTLGPFTEQFEVAFARAIGARHAVATSSGTAALEITLRILDAGGKRVAVPTNTNFATMAALLAAGGEPVLIDMDPTTFCASFDALREARTNRSVGGCIWVHIGGIISPDFLEVVQYCRKERIFLVEDAAHAHGSRMAGRSAGTFGDAGAFSFFPTKVMTTMEGGMITTDDARHAELARSYRNQGKRGSKFGGVHHDLGSSWRMTEISAAMGILHLRKLDAMVARRKSAAERMARVFDELQLPHCSTEHMDQASNYKLIVKYGMDIPVEDLKRQFRALGVELGGGVYEIPLHCQPVFDGIAEACGLENATKFCPRHFCPPLTSGLTDEAIDRIGDAARAIFA